MLLDVDRSIGVNISFLEGGEEEPKTWIRYKKEFGKGLRSVLWFVQNCSAWAMVSHVIAYNTVAAILDQKIWEFHTTSR